MNPFKRWMQDASAAEKKQLADLADTTVGTLYQISGSYRTKGVPSVDPALAARLELATRMMRRRGLAPVKRTDLSPVCAACEFARRHK